MKKEEIIIYWAPWYHPLTSQQQQMLGGITPIMYEEPSSLWEHLNKNLMDQKASRTFIQCPAFRESVESVYFIKNPVTTSISVNISDSGVIGDVIQHESKGSRGVVTMPHAPTIQNQLLIQYTQAYGFFASEPCLMRMTSPWFSNAPHMKYGSLVVGTFDIGRWYRPVNLEFNLWDLVNDFVIEADEPLAYFEFSTTKKIVFKQYELTDKLVELATNAIHARSSRWHSLNARYELFAKARYKEMVMKEINKSLL